MFPRGESASILQISVVSASQRLNIIHLLCRFLTEKPDLYNLSQSHKLSKLLEYKLDWKREEFWSLKRVCIQSESLPELSRAASDLQYYLEGDRKSYASKSNCWF